MTVHRNRKWIWLVVTALFITSVLPAGWAGAADPSAAGENVLVNPGFEEVDADGNAVGWKTYRWRGTPEYTVDSNEKMAGERSFQIASTSGEPTSAMLEQSFTVEAGKKYYVGGWFRTEQISADPVTVKIRIRQTTKSKEYIVLDTQFGTTDWMYFGKVFDDLMVTDADGNPMDASPYVFNAYLGNATRGKDGKVWFDELVVMEADEKTELRETIRAATLLHDQAVEGNEEGQYAPGSKAALMEVLMSAQAAADDPEADPAAIAAALEAVKLAMRIFQGQKNGPDAGNLLANPGFEELDENGQAAGWGTYRWRGTPEYLVDAGEWLSGAHSFQIASTSGEPTSAMLEQGFTVEAGKKYYVGGWFRTEQISADPVTVKIRIRQTTKSKEYVLFDANFGTTNWTYFGKVLEGLEVTDPEGNPVDSSRYVFNAYLGNATSGKDGRVWFDDLVVMEADEKTELRSVLRTAKKLHEEAVEGGESGQYRPGSKAVLMEAIEQGEQVAEDPEAAPEAIQAAVETVAEAVEAFVKERVVIPAIPTDVTAEVLPSGTVKLAWDIESRFYNSAAYDIYRSTKSGFQADESTFLGSSDERMYYDGATRPGTTYYYKVAAHMADQPDRRSAPSEEIAVKTPDAFPPIEGLSGVKAMLKINNQVGIYWDPPREKRGERIAVWGSESPIVSVTDPGVVKITDQVDPRPGQVEIDAKEHYYPYYAVSLRDANGEESGITAVETTTFLPRVKDEIVEVDHPFLLATQEEIDQTLAHIEQYPEMRKYYEEKIIAPAEEYIERYGSLAEAPAKGSSEHTRITRAASTLGIAYALSKDERYAEAAKHILLLYVDYYRKHDYISSQHRDDGYHTFFMAWAYDFIYYSPVMTEEDRKTIEEGFFREQADRLLALSRGKIDALGTTPWSVGMIGFLLKDQDYLNAALDFDLMGLEYIMVNGFNNDGSWWEQSIDYHEERIRRFAYLAEAAYHSNYDMWNLVIEGERDPSLHINWNREDLRVEGIHFKDMFDYPYYFQFSNLTRPDFGDAYVSKLVPYYPQEAIYKHYGDPKYAWLLRHTFGVHRELANNGNEFAIFLMDPVLTEGDFTFHIGNGWVNQGLYNKLGSSIFTGIGAAILRSPGDYTQSTNIAMHWSPYGSSGHSHGDKLGIMLYARDHTILADTGRYPYGSYTQKEYAKHTIAHNTLVVDEKSQLPYTDSTNEWITDNVIGEPTHGFLSSVSIGPKVHMVRAGSDLVYGKLGVGLDRTVLLVDDYVIDVFHADGSSPHRYDYPLHVNGTLEDITVAMEVYEPMPALGESLGYKHIKKQAEGATDGLWSSVWKISDNLKLKTTMLGGVDTKVIKALGLSSDGSNQREMMIARRDGQEDAAFVTILEPFAHEQELREISVLDAVYGGVHTQGVRIDHKHKGAVDTFLTSLEAAEMHTDGLAANGIAAFRRQIGHQDEVLLLAEGTRIVGNRIAYESSEVSTAQLTLLPGNAYRLDYNGSAASEVRITGSLIRVLGMTGYQVFEMALADDIQLTPVSSAYENGAITFTAQPDTIYVIGKENALRSMPAPTTVPIGETFGPPNR